MMQYEDCEHLVDEEIDHISQVNKPKESRVSSNCLLNNKGHLKIKDLDTFRAKCKESRSLDLESSHFTFAFEKKAEEMRIKHKTRYTPEDKDECKDSEVEIKYCKKFESYLNDSKTNKFSVNQRKLSSTIMLAFMLK